MLNLANRDSNKVNSGYSGFDLANGVSNKANSAYSGFDLWMIWQVHSKIKVLSPYLPVN